MPHMCILIYIITARTDMCTYSAITALPNVLDDFFQELAQRTGWIFTVLAGGPKPINGSKIRTLGYVFITIINALLIS
jgi:hypothetical protein